MKVQEIFLSFEDRKEYFLETEEGQTDVIVLLDTGEKFTASFFSFSRLLELRKQHRSSNEFLFGAYFWSRNMILINDCDRKNIWKVINYLIDEGDFLNAFRKIENNL